MPIITFLENFAHVSVFRKYRAKRWSSSCTIAYQHKFKHLRSNYAGPGDARRYLGVLVGQQNAEFDNCIKCIRSLWRRLVLARETNHIVEQRSQLASAIAGPHITLLARHRWSPPALITRVQGLILDFVWGVRDGKRFRLWLYSNISFLPLQHED